MLMYHIEKEELFAMKVSYCYVDDYDYDRNNPVKFIFPNLSQFE